MRYDLPLNGKLFLSEALFGPAMSAIGKAIALLATSSEADVPSAVLYDVAPDFEFPEFTTSDYAGLLSVSLIRGNGESRIFVCWKTGSAAATRGPTFDKRLGLNAPVWRGPIAAVSVAKSPLIKRATELVVLLAAAVGVLSAVRDYFPDLFSKPEVVIRPADSNPVNIVERGVLATQMGAYNEARYGKAYLGLSPPQLKADCKTGKPLSTLNIDPEKIGQIAAGNSARFAVSGLVPELPNNIPPKQLRVCVSGTADAGWLRTSEPVAASQLVTVWPEVGLEQRFSAGRTIGTMVFHIYPGRPFKEGVSGAVIAKFPVKPRSFHLQSNPSERPIFVADGNVWVSTLEFQTAPLQAFVPYRDQATVRFDAPLTTEQWRFVENNFIIETQ